MIDAMCEIWIVISNNVIDRIYFKRYLLRLRDDFMLMSLPENTDINEARVINSTN